MRLSGLRWCCLLNLAFGWGTLLNAQQNPNGQIPVAGMSGRLPDSDPRSAGSEGTAADGPAAAVHRDGHR